MQFRFTFGLTSIDSLIIYLLGPTGPTILIVDTNAQYSGFSQKILVLFLTNQINFKNGGLGLYSIGLAPLKFPVLMNLMHEFYCSGGIFVIFFSCAWIESHCSTCVCVCVCVCLWERERDKETERQRERDFFSLWKQGI